VNNPTQTIRIADLLDMYKNDFNYEDLYKIVGNWLQSEFKYFVLADESLWNTFIESFCDRFYSRNLNFYTTLDFKLKLRDVLKASKNRAKRIYEVDLLEINPLITFNHLTEKTEKSTGVTNSNNNSNSTSISNGTTSNADNTQSSNKTNDNSTSSGNSANYDLHSDTPSNAVNIDDLFSVAKNFVTDANNNKAHNNSESYSNSTYIGNVSRSSKNDSESSLKENSTNAGKTEFTNDNIFNEISKGYNGEPTELIRKYMNLKTDVIQFYLDEIENACLFSSILY
jgi:hypothetical protein